jgi:hypothetical protein
MAVPQPEWPAFQHEEQKLNDRRDEDVGPPNVSLEWFA